MSPEHLEPSCPTFTSCIRCFITLQSESVSVLSVHHSVQINFSHVTCNSMRFPFSYKIQNIYWNSFSVTFFFNRSLLNRFHLQLSSCLVLLSHCSLDPTASRSKGLLFPCQFQSNFLYLKFPLQRSDSWIQIWISSIWRIKIANKCLIETEYNSANHIS